jgi:hypothetical protein
MICLLCAPNPPNSQTGTARAIEQVFNFRGLSKPLKSQWGSLAAIEFQFE